MIPYSRQNIVAEDIAAVEEVLKSEYLTQGNTVKAFEQALAQYCTVPFAISTCNATAALHVACLALGVNEKSRVWVAANSFVASANCARYCNAKVGFVDVDSETGLISIDGLKYELEQADKDGQTPDVLVVVHIAGVSCDMESISALCKPRGIAIIEDACHALGGSYQGKKIGDCRFSDCTVFSFHPVKPLTTGEGGMLLSRNEVFIEKARLYCQHGIERRNSNFVSESSNLGWYYEQQILGYNYRLSDIQAALGLSQLRRLDERIQVRRNLAKAYFEAFGKTDIKFPQEQCYSESSWHLFPIRFPAEEQRNSAYSLLRARGYGVNVHYISLLSHPYYQSLGLEKNDYPKAEMWGKTELSIPLHDFVSRTMQDEIIDLCLNESVNCENRVDESALAG